MRHMSIMHPQLSRSVYLSLVMCHSEILRPLQQPLQDANSRELATKKVLPSLHPIRVTRLPASSLVSTSVPLQRARSSVQRFMVVSQKLTKMVNMFIRITIAGGTLMKTDSQTGIHYGRIRVRAWMTFRQLHRKLANATVDGMLLKERPIMAIQQVIG